jgi:hypothetical protein
VSRAPGRSTDLVAVVALALLGALVAIFSPPTWIQVILVGPLALLLPGYAIAAALFPPGSLPRGDRFVHVFVFCVGAASLGMLLLQLAVDVRRAAWVCLLLVITLVAAAIAWRRRTVPNQATRSGFGRPPAGLTWMIGFLAATGLAGLSIAVASDGVREQQSQQVFASLWAVPTGGPNSDKPVKVGILNHGGPISYRLVVRVDGQLVESFPVRLDGNRQWRRTLPAPIASNSPNLNIALIHDGERYRAVELNIQGEED